MTRPPGLSDEEWARMQKLLPEAKLAASEMEPIPDLTPNPIPFLSAP